MIAVADNLQPLNPVVSEAMRKLDPAPIREIVGRCVKAGARMIDINPGYLSPRNEDRMTFLVETVQKACSLPLILDSPNPKILARGLASCRRKPILNGLSLDERKIREILPLAVEHDTPLIILLMNEKSFTPVHMEGKISLALQLREHALAAGLSDDSLIFDPVLPNLSWPEAVTQAGECVKTVRMLASGAVLQEPVRTIVGLSNLRSGLRNRFPVQVETAFLNMLAGAGLGMVLANAMSPETMGAAQFINQAGCAVEEPPA